MTTVYKEACARRYVELHEARPALVTHQNDVVRYAERSGDFPRLILKQGSLMPRLDRASDLRGVGDVYLDDAKLWFDGPLMADLAVQTLFQKKGFGITLLALSDHDHGGRTDIEDAFDRYTRWN